MTIDVERVRKGLRHFLWRLQWAADPENAYLREERHRLEHANMDWRQAYDVLWRRYMIICDALNGERAKVRTLVAGMEGAVNAAETGPTETTYVVTKHIQHSHCARWQVEMRSRDGDTATITFPDAQRDWFPLGSSVKIAYVPREAE